MKSYFKYSNLKLILCAKGVHDDGNGPDDEELFRAEQQRIEEIEVR